MRHDLQALSLLLTQAERQQAEAFAEQLKAEAAKKGAQAQAEQLFAYRRDYEQRWQGEFARVGKIEVVRAYQGFVQRLSQAIEQQQRIAAHAAVQVERAEAIVRGHELRAAALKKLVERRLRESERAAEAKEQKESDDRSTRANWNRLTAPGSTAAL